ncbi:MAG TPA: type II toxin-antitoxin system PrlF family antitoxin [Gemmatimonadaceae bacterium]|nr:type II toxin-antitoxin system PrlF family antitoxin [Gemmatimonadaceae bacterium]HRQ77348.1 type II toxin-antitoxin system PrlF family antitoxin [Gemmatimonadaceae bacterium]
MSTLTIKYQATIPKVVRETLALAAGDRVEFLVEPSGEVRLRKALPDLAELRAIEASLAPEWGSDEDEVAYGRL